ncbi:Elongation factor Tu GTP binding domain [Rhizoctonia solani]|uniref:Elongation factor 1 alpha-like protein n=1 Tax=Rhizoctonia solani TaxID=456999 RepID=A0A8H8SW60_9AGAM|nr:Elongation factor Tu GTP binding domain [Rhizoctonia solani]QRW19182.1 Elongation factor Tu GTP binding domain [Rhizoctonia solani]
MNIHDELAEDDVSDTYDEDEEMTNEQKDQMAVGLAQVRSVLGEKDASGVDDKQIKDALWDSYFDVEGTISWLLDQRAKEAAAAAKKAITVDSEHAYTLVPDQDEAIQLPLSALQRLALQRRQAGSSSASHTTDKPSGLAGLAKGLSKKSLSVGPPLSATPTPANPPPKSSKLSALAQKSASLRANPVAKPPAPQTNTPTNMPLSKLALRIKAQKDAQEAAAQPQVKIDPHELELDTQPFKPEFERFGNLRPNDPYIAADPQVALLRKLRTGPSLFGDILASRQDSTNVAVSLAQVYSGIVSGPPSAFQFNTPSPDDAVMAAREGTRLNAYKKASGIPPSNKATPKTAPSQRPSGSKKQLEQETTQNADTLDMDMAGLNIVKPQDSQPEEEAPPKISIARERILEEARKEATSGDSDGRKRLSLVVIGHVDAGKSTLMGRLLYECGQVEEKRRREHERASEKAGKASFSWAWELDAGAEERERGITMDIAQSVLPTEHRIISILDAPGHKDFVPNMISGASQADCALLVVDAATGAFEKGFEGGGQTREHIGVVRSLGVRNIVVAVNKMDMVDYRKSRFDEIQVALLPFLVQAGFNTSRVTFVPCAGVSGVNLTKSEEPALQSWWDGKPIVDHLDRLEPPIRDFDTPLRIPISNVFKGVTSSGIGISGRISGGIVQVGERVRIVPGDETAVIKSIEKDDVNVQWAAAGSNVTIYLANIDPIHLSIGSVLCSPGDIVPLASSFNAQIIVFDIQLPIIGGSSVELFHHSREVPASVSKLIETVDRATGAVIKRNPRVLPKSSSAKVTISLRVSSGPSARPASIPLEPFSVNKEMGRILLRRGGETIAAGE